jgi:hypothetical protein
MRIPRLLPLLALAAGLAAPAAAHAEPVTETAAAGPVQATFSYDQKSDFEYTGLHLQILRAGQPLYDAPVALRSCPEPYCVPARQDGGRALEVSDLDGDGEPEVQLTLYTGGAHCCTELRVLRLQGTTYVAADHDFGDPSFAVEDLDRDGRPELLTADDRFAYRYASYAASGLPVQVIRYAQGRFSDVTSRYPALVRNDARRFWRTYRARRAHPSREPLGALAAWAADQYRLGRRAAARRVLRRELRAGRLRAADPWPHGRRFIADLDRFLRRAGYWR